MAFVYVLSCLVSTAAFHAEWFDGWSKH